MATSNIIAIEKTVELGQATIYEVRIALDTKVAEFHYKLTNGTDTTDEAFSIDLAQWSKFAGMVDDLLAKAATAIEAEAKGKLKNKEKQNV